jgi:hypothetical protein
MPPDRGHLAEALLGLPARHVPQLLAGPRVVGPDSLLAVEHQLLTARVVPDDRGAPAHALVAPRLPDHLAGAFLQGPQPGGAEALPLVFGLVPLAAVIAVDDDQVLEEQGGRRPHGPAGRGDQRAEGLLPLEVAVKVVTEQAGRAEERVDSFAVGRAGRRGVRVPGVDRLGGNVLRRRPLPEDLAALPADAEDPALRPRPSRRGQEDAVAPDDRGGVAEAGQVELPFEVLVPAPAQGDTRIAGVAVLARPPPARPGRDVCLRGRVFSGLIRGCCQDRTDEAGQEQGESQRGSQGHRCSFRGDSGLNPDQSHLLVAPVWPILSAALSRSARLSQRCAVGEGGWGRSAFVPPA